MFETAIRPEATLTGALACRDALVAVVAGLDPESVPLPEAAAWWEAFDRMERVASTAKTLLARRVAAGPEWQRLGFASAAEFMARRAGSSPGAARREIDASKHLAKLPRTEQAARRGELSDAQLGLIADAAGLNPEAEGRLLATAGTGTLRDLKDQAQRARAAADTDRAATEARIHRARSFRSWTDPDGTWRASLAGTIAAGARIEQALKPLIDQRLRDGARAGQREPRDAHAFDALEAALTSGAPPAPQTSHRPAESPAPPPGPSAEQLPLISDADPADAEGDADADTDGAQSGVEFTRQSGPKVPPRYLTQIRVDIEALHRGRIEGDELCEIRGLGPISVSEARRLLGESLLQIVLTRGVEVATIAPAGRGWHAHQRTAALWQSDTCSVAGCGRRRVQLDHRIGVAEGGPTTIANVDPLCRPHHDLKTHHRWALVPGKGKRDFVPPEDPRHPDSRPPP